MLPCNMSEPKCVARHQKSIGMIHSSSEGIVVYLKAKASTEWDGIKCAITSIYDNRLNIL